MLTPGQIKAARALLKWKQADLAREAGVAEATIKNFERGDSLLGGRTLGKIEEAFKAAGIEFLGDGQASLGGGAGVRFTAPGRP